MSRRRLGQLERRMNRVLPAPMDPEQHHAHWAALCRWAGMTDSEIAGFREWGARLTVPDPSWADRPPPRSP